MSTTLTIFFSDTSINPWAIAIFLLIGLFVLIYFFKSIAVKKAKLWALTTSNSWDNYVIVTFEKSVVPMLYIGSFYAVLGTLPLSEKIANISNIVFLATGTYFTLRILSSTFRKFVLSFIQTQENSEAKQKQASGLVLIVNIVMWILGIIFMIDNLGYDVTSLIAGLGIGGIAIALAAQTILGDLFSYFVIFFDRPFEIGDFIVIEDKSGNVEHIGIKTTRIRTLSGEQLICSNTDLTNARMHNYKRLQKRRILFNLGVTYQTSSELLSEIPLILRQIIESEPNVSFDRAHFSGYGDFSLNFEVVYHVLDPDYNFYMDKQQAIYLDIFKAFEKRSIDFAYPTQTLLMQTEGKQISIRP